MIFVALALVGLVAALLVLHTQERRAWDEERRRYVSAVLLSEKSPTAPTAVLRPQAAEEPREFIVTEGL